jgi:hypothetical protein
MIVLNPAGYPVGFTVILLTRLSWRPQGYMTARLSLQTAGCIGTRMSGPWRIDDDSWG